MALLLRLTAYEPSQVDDTAILSLKTDLGGARCREIIEEAAYHMIDRLSRIERALVERDFVAISRLSRNLAALSKHTGLGDVSIVARNLADCAETGDIVAISALTARLSRIGEASLFAVLQLADHFEV